MSGDTLPGASAGSSPVQPTGALDSGPPGSPSEGLHLDGQVHRGTFVLDVELRLRPGRVLGVLGPNGAGKTTLLRALAGLESLTAGELRLRDTVLDAPDRGVFVPPPERRVGVVFQDYRLFPHLTAKENVAFGPRSRKVPARTARARAEQWLRRLGLADFAARRPGQLSGGQAQRVALARALATEPHLLVLDEPLAALDTATKLEVRTRLRRHLTEFGGPVLLVTHDPVEAMVMADELLVLEAGHVVQRGTPAEVAARPRTPYVARLVGLNFYTGVLAGGTVRLDGGDLAWAPDGSVPDGPVLVAVRPESVSVFKERPHGSPRNVWRATVEAMEAAGQRVRLTLRGAPDVMVDVTPAAVAELDLEAGAQVWCSVKATDVMVYER